MNNKQKKTIGLINNSYISTIGEMRVVCHPHIISTSTNSLGHFIRDFTQKSQFPDSATLLSN